MASFWRTGFIECAETYASYQCDVFVHKNEYTRGGCSIGRQVEFSVQMSEKHQPRATNIVSAPGGLPAQGGGGQMQQVGYDAAAEARRNLKR